MTFIGTRMRRLEDPDLVRGDACFVGDLKVADALTVRFVRCPLGRARVRSLPLEKVRRRAHAPSQMLARKTSEHTRPTAS